MTPEINPSWPYPRNFRSHDEDDTEPEEYPQRKRITCNRCGAAGLHWVERFGGKFELYAGALKHVCRPSTDDFKAVE